MMEPDVNVTTWPLPLGQHPELRVGADFASLAFLPLDPGEHPRVFCAVPERDAPKVDIVASGGITRVSVGWEALRWGFWRDRRRFHLIFCIPHDLRLRVETDAARIEIARLRFADLEVSADTGDLRIDDVEGRMKLSTDTGRIVALDVTGSFDVRTDTGAVRVRAKGLDPGTSSASTDMGAIRVELPAGLPVLVDAKADLGAVRVDVPRYATASSALVARSAMGLVEVTEYQPAPPPAVEGGPYRAPPPRVAPDLGSGAEAEEPPDEIDRVVRLMVAGKITAAEAEQLLAELGR
jgi:hypothetical protein